MKIIIITGPPYSGKGTQCEVLKKTLGYHHISTGDRCRQEKQEKTEIGMIMSEYEERGDLVPDELMKDLFSKILDENIHSKGIILDGYPRTMNQVKNLIELVQSKGLTISKVLNIEVPHEELLRRASKRAETSNRKDDKDPEIHLKRIYVFESLTVPAINHMKDVLTVTNFDGMGQIEEITDKIVNSLNTL